MLKLLILFCLIIKTHSWTWKDYPSPRGPDFSKCGVTKSTYVCDPDGMLTDQQRKEIVELVEDLKKTTKREKSTDPCGLIIVLALAIVKIIPGSDFSDYTHLCKSDRWTLSDTAECESDVVGMELNKDGFRYCYWQSSSMFLYKNDKNENLDVPLERQLNKTIYFDALRNFVTNIKSAYMRRLSTFDKRDVSNETNIKLSEVQQSLQDTKTTLTKMRDQQNKTLSGFTANMEENKLKLSEMRQSLDQQNKTLVETNKKLSEMKQLQWHMFIGKNITNNKPLEFSPTSQHYSNNLLGIIAIIFCLIICLVLLFLICQFRQFKNYLNQRNASNQLMTPIQPVEIVEKKRENEENEEATKPLLNL